MAIAYKIGDKVNEVVDVMKNGEVTAATIGETDGTVYFKVKYTDAIGNEQENWFAEEVLEAVV
jgi:DNA-directed RNA polymerase subunit E'/Rpb7